MSCDFSEANLRRILSEDCKYEHVHTESGDFLGDFIEVDFDNSPTINSITEEKIRKNIELLTEKERLIICKRLGINGSASSLEKIADEYNVNTASIYNIEKKAIRKLLQNKL